MSLFPSEHKCPSCGGKFLAGDPWGYVRNDKKYCSWHCLRNHDKRVRAGRTEKRLGDKERREILTLLRDGVKPQKVSETVGVRIQVVLYYQKKIGA